LLYYTGKQGEVFDTYKRSCGSRRKEVAQAAEQEAKDLKARAAARDEGAAGPLHTTAAGDYRVSFPFDQPPALAGPGIAVRDASFAYDKGPQLLAQLSTAVTMGTRVAIVGANGTGKTTLFKLLTRELLPTDGEIVFNARLRIGVYNQHFVDQLPYDISPIKHLTTLWPDKEIHEVRRALGMFGLPSFSHEFKIKTLSGGQKARVLFAQISLGHPDILFFDEPTNHLDIESIEALCAAIKNFEGGVVLVSHDVRLLTETECTVWQCGGCDATLRAASGANNSDDPEPHSGVAKFKGGCDGYVKRVREQFEQAIEDFGASSEK